ncbi:formyltransferase [Methylobacterium haplocladii]|uniref:Tungsten-containing formylmethanofuran dehydrogenase subunit B n=1 Tax=Methylobacterium haplocladii TaxID=1176176 RepID=A0A512IUV2_9HYPH|nr:formyltransferase [Methylobacterium haplocladii]GEP01477.1 hypothetical protein MHA02_38640 [Methylobacterium haplocladii]GJD85020.1 Formyltransferase/hydrolase complex Fhc subunit B [Methylobacterium haplocladii]GLS58895.1 hypothetical protein GCM10007887_15610 [Methylobacterium haplocladii]
MAAWVKGDAADTDAAVEAAAALLAAARMPVFAGLCADVAAVRAAYRLADRIGASLDPVAGPGLYAELGSLSAGGALTTTAPETLGRADTVLVVGSRPWDGDLVSEIADTKPVRGLSAGDERTVLALGGPRNGTSRHVAYGIGNVGLDVAIGHLRAFVRGHLAGEAAFGDLAQKLASAKFGVVIYDAGEIGEAGVDMLQGLLKDLNEKTRFFALGLADPFQGRSVLQLAAWTTGQAPRVGFGRHLPEHDPWRFDSARQVADGEADAALWLAALPAPRPDWLVQFPAIAIVGEDSADARPDTAEIVITVGVPGSSAGGAVWNERRGVIGYVPASGNAVAATAAGVIAGISQKIAEKGASC